MYDRGVEYGMFSISHMLKCQIEVFNCSTKEK